MIDNEMPVYAVNKYNKNRYITVLHQDYMLKTTTATTAFLQN